MRTTTAALAAALLTMPFVPLPASGAAVKRAAHGLEQPFARLLRLGDVRTAGGRRPGPAGPGRLPPRHHRRLLAGRPAYGRRPGPRRHPLPLRRQGAGRLPARQGPQARPEPVGGHQGVLRRRPRLLQERGRRRRAGQGLGRRLRQVRLVQRPGRRLPRPERPADRPDPLPAHAPGSRRRDRVRHEQRGRQHRAVALGQGREGDHLADQRLQQAHL